MANASLGTLAISMSLWAADLGASHLQKPLPPVDDKPHVAAVATKTCEAGVQAPTDADSDLEVVVCAKPVAR